MRSLILLLTPMLCAACQKERSFEERYSQTANSVEERARAIDQELDEAGSSPCPDDRKQDCR